MTRTSTRPSNFSAEKADQAERFFLKLAHVKGQWSGSRFELQPWQRDEIIRPLFGTLLKDGRRQYRTALIGVPRKNGKSTLGAGIALKLLFADQEPGSEVYSAAADRDQAAIVFDMARTMVESSPQLARRAKVYRRAIEVPHTGSIYKVLSAEAYSKHGSSPHGVIFDELHAQPSRELWDVLTTGQGARRQPLTVAITTAGYDRANICYELYEYGQRLQSRQIDDPTFFFRWWGADLTDDWEDEKVWARVNPNLGISPSIDFLRAEMRQAKQNPARQNTVRRLFLNQWTLAASRWFDLGLWDENAGLVVEEQLEGRLCYGGLDLASTSDFTAWVLFFPPEPGKEEEGAQVLARFWLPRAAVERRTPMREQLAVWEREGWLKVTEGNVIDEAAIEAQIDADAQRFNVRSVNYDRWGSRQLIRRLEDAGMPCEGVAQTASHLNAPCLEVERLLGLGQLHHGGNPVLRWQADSVQVAIDSSGAIKPDRKKSTERIDGIAALVDAIHGHLSQQDEGVTAFIAG